MPNDPAPSTARVAIVDYGMGNLFSVQKACEWAGLQARITCDSKEVESSDGVILPGVGAFGDAMETLRARGLVEVLQEAARCGKPFLAICLGMQLLMRRSHEFGVHPGLGIVEGEVIRLSESAGESIRVKVPHVGWNRIAPPVGLSWGGSWLGGVPQGAFMYFVHSFYVKPSEDQWVVSVTPYGPTRFASSIGRGNLFACQFHPERSGSQGLLIYRNFARTLTARILEEFRNVGARVG